MRRLGERPTEEELQEMVSEVDQVYTLCAYIFLNIYC